METYSSQDQAYILGVITNTTVVSKYLSKEEKWKEMEQGYELCVRRNMSIIQLHVYFIYKKIRIGVRFS